MDHRGSVVTIGQLIVTGTMADITALVLILAGKGVQHVS